MIYCDAVNKLMSSYVKMTFYVECYTENEEYKYLSVGIMNYICDVICCPYSMTLNSLCRNYGDFHCGIFDDVIVIWIYCICTCFQEGGMRLIYCGVYVEIVICGDMQVHLRVVSCVGNPLLYVHIHHTQNIIN